MGKFSESLSKAADNAERLAAAMESIPGAGSDSGAGGGAGGAGGPAAPGQAVFNTTINMADASLPSTRSSGGGSGGGGGSKIFPGANNGGMSIEFIRYLNSMGIWNTKNASKLVIENMMKEFEKLLKKRSDLGLALRSGGG